MKRMGMPAILAMLASLVLSGASLAAAPANDLYPDRIDITPLPFDDTLDTTDATTDSDDDDANTNCGAPATEASVWYSLDGSDAWVAVDVSQSDYSAGVIVVTGGPGGFNLEACGPGAVAFEALSGTTYKIMAFDDTPGGSNGGELKINAEEIGPPPVVDITLDRYGRFDSKTGSALISGTITCDGVASFSFVDVFVRQVVGRFFIDGYGFIEGFECDGSTQDWEAEVFGQNGKFKGGYSLAVSFGVACGEFLCGEDYEEREVRLRGKR